MEHNTHHTLETIIDNVKKMPTDGGIYIDSFKLALINKKASLSLVKFKSKKQTTVEFYLITEPTETIKQKIKNILPSLVW